MDSCGLPVGVSALACALARELPDEADLLLLAAICTHLGDTLALIAAQRAACGGLGAAGQNGQAP